MTNKFTLTGHGVEISYMIGANRSFPALTYEQGTLSKSFLPDAIHTDSTDLGNLVTVPLEATIEPGGGGTTFSVFLPTFNVPMGQTVEFKTIGLYKECRVVAPPVYQVATWRTIHMHGIAQTVLVPLEQPVAT